MTGQSTVVPVYLALGSNIGDRRANLLKAVDLLDRRLGISHAALSSFYENPARGFVGEDFVNAVVRYDICYRPESAAEPASASAKVICLGDLQNLNFQKTDSFPLSPKDEFATGILRVCKAVERAMGRSVEGIRLDEKGNRIYASRIIDIDILTVGDWSINLPWLTIPHPRMRERDFVIIPLREVLS